MNTTTVALRVLPALLLAVTAIAAAVAMQSPTQTADAQRDCAVHADVRTAAVIDDGGPLAVNDPQFAEKAALRYRELGRTTR